MKRVSILAEGLGFAVLVAIIALWIILGGCL